MKLKCKKKREHIEKAYVSIFKKKKLQYVLDKYLKSNLEFETSVIFIYIHIYLHLKTQ